ncbi:MAG TPA: hypothetical protein VI603_16560 [Saprospiraceae bacterium]|nr:hypothetical protein [Saprospiraceae bacterium]
MTGQKSEKSAAHIRSDRWGRWYSLVIIWHILVILLMYLFTLYFHPIS